MMKTRKLAGAGDAAVRALSYNHDLQSITESTNQTILAPHVKKKKLLLLF